MVSILIFLNLCFFSFGFSWAGVPTGDSHLNPEGKLADVKGKHALIYTKNGEGFVHENIPFSIRALEKLLNEKGMTFESSEDPALFTPEKLKKFDVLIFSNTDRKS